MLVHGEGFTTGVAGNQLEFGVGQTGMPSEPCDALMAKTMGRCFDTSIFSIKLDDLLDSSCGELGVSPSLEEPTIVGMGRNVGSQGRGK